MSTKFWLDLTMYGIRLFVNLDQVTKINHTLVVAGPKVELHRPILQQLGFRRDERFATEYWVRPLSGMTPRLIHEVFPQSFMREMPIEIVMPALALKAKTADKPSSKIKDATDGAQLSNARNVLGSSNRGESITGAKRSSVLVADDPRNTDDSKPEIDDRVRPAGPAYVVSTTAAGAPINPSTPAGERLEEEQPAAEHSGLPAAGQLDESQQAGRTRDIDRGIKQELERRNAEELKLTPAQTLLISLAGSVQARITLPSLVRAQLAVPDNWLVMNAARPLLGHKTLENGPFLAGRFYSAIDPADWDTASRFVDLNKNLDAHVVIEATKEEQINMLLLDDEYADRYRSKFEGDELYDVLRGRISDLAGLSYEELLGRKTLAVANPLLDKSSNQIQGVQPSAILVESLEILLGSSPKTENPDVLAQNAEHAGELVSEVDQPSSNSDDELKASIRKLFNEGNHSEAYQLFSSSPASARISLDAFIESMHASSGGPQATLRLSPSQRTNLSKAGASTRAIERFATNDNLNEVFSEDTLAANELAVVLTKHEIALDALLRNDGWVPGEGMPDSSVERSTSWKKDNHQIWRLLDRSAWQYSGHVDGQVLPAFSVIADFNKSDNEIAELVLNEAKTYFNTIIKSDTSTALKKDLPAAQIIENDESDEFGPEIDRVWRGASYDDISLGQQRPRLSFKERPFQALNKAEIHGASGQEFRDMAGFMGWGGIAQQVRTDNKAPSKNREGKLIASALGIESGTFNRVLMENRLESYYTPAAISRAMWDLLAKAGVPSDGRYLDAGCGMGIFYATAPDKVQRHGRLVGIECDPVASRFARAMVPDMTLLEQRYERAVLDRNFDAVVGNVPFGEAIISDDRYPRATHIHDYFIVRSLDHLKPGGVMAVITSSGTMDKNDSSVRHQIMERANLVAGIRMPADTFSSQGAQVTTDILFFQRRPAGTSADYDFTKTNEIAKEWDGSEHTFSVNQYFLDHPENVIGEFTVESSAFGPKLTVRAKHITDNFIEHGITDGIAAEVAKIGSTAINDGIFGRNEWPALSKNLNTKLESSEGFGDALMLDVYDGFVGDMIAVDGVVHEILDLLDQFDDDGIKIGSKYVAAQLAVPSNDTQLLLSYIALRDSTRKLIKEQLKGNNDQLQKAQLETKAIYDVFVDNYGPVNTPKNLKSFGDDTGSAEVCALENYDEDSGAITSLADVFTKRVVLSESNREINDSADAYYASIDRSGNIDLDYMENVSGISKDQLLQELVGTLIFREPSSGELIRSDQYLSGNVVRKLAEAQQAVLTDTAYQINIDGLSGVQPTMVPFEDITITLGASWIPPDEIRNFTSNLLSANLTESDFKVRYSNSSYQWSVEVSNTFKRNYEAQRNALFGTPRASFEVLLEKTLNKQKPTHTYKDDKGKTRTDEKATLESRSKQEELNSLFYRWIASDPDRASLFADLYNESTNVLRVPNIDGSHITFPGLNPNWVPREHQRNMVATAMMGYNVMAAHAVGAGKTFEMVAIAMKLKQIGMVTKPMIAVPNHMLGQISREAKQMYPGARILMVTNEDLRGNNRKRFLARARNNDWDIVVCTHSLLNQVSAPKDTLARLYEDSINVLQSKLLEADSARLERQISAKIKSTESVRDAVLARFDEDSQRGGTLTIDMLGVDSLQVDEGHLYKNLDLESSMNVLGVTTSGSQRAYNIWGLSQYMQQLHGRAFGINFFTGTPVANSMCELYVHNKLLRNDLLKELGINHFDEWAVRFGEVVSNLEALPEGGGFRVNERFARFVNLPEMLRLFRTFADVKTKDQMKLPRPVVHSSAISVEQSEWQKAFMKHLAIRAVAIRNGSVKPDVDNMLSIASAGRKASLDMRLVVPTLPDDSSLKLDAVAKNIHLLWERHADVKATQLVFIDLGTPGKNKQFSTYTELKCRLIELGLPERDIAFIHDAKNNDAKEVLFSQVRSGEKRVLIGSTERMGVGTNVQERMCALHNVDCPWRPADIEQRIGRIDRQGNLYFKEVNEYRYTTKDSFDLFLWETNKRKATFITQALSDPDIAGRDVSEEMDIGYAEVMAVTTGNPKIREKVQVDDQVVKLERKEKAWYGDRAQRLHAESHLSRRIQTSENLLDVERKAMSLLPQVPWKCATVEGSITGVQDGSTTWLYATNLGNALMARIVTVDSRMMLNNQVEAPLNANVGGIELHLKQNHLGEMKGTWSVFGKSTDDGQAFPMNIVHFTKNNQILGRGIRQWFDRSKSVTDLENDIMMSKRGIEALGDLVSLRNDVSPYDDELADARSRKSELDRWFAAQDFNKLDSGFDPYLAMLRDYKSVSLVDDELEAVELQSCALTINDEVDHSAQEEVHTAKAKSLSM